MQIDLVFRLKLHPTMGPMHRTTSHTSSLHMQLKQHTAARLQVQQFAMNNEQNADTNLWAAANNTKVSLRIRGTILNYAPSSDVIVAVNQPETAVLQ